jgi:S1-C subfamily serine protease
MSIVLHTAYYGGGPYALYCLGMWGFNWVDAIIVVLLIFVIVEGVRAGFLTQLFGIMGFFGALFLAGWLLPHALVHIHDQTLRTAVNATLVLVIAMVAGMYASDQGEKIHWSFRLGKLTGKRQLETWENILGALPGAVAVLALVWLLGVMIGRLPFAGFSNSVSDSRIVQQLTRSLPPAPAVFADFNKQVNPNALPQISAEPKPYEGFPYSAAEVAMAEAKAQASIVRITSFGCGGLVSGSGFVAAPNLVATNAHVLAGVKRPIIKHGGNSYEGIPVFFDANLDFAILRVDSLKAPALPAANSVIADNTTVSVIGYPGGNYTATPGLIREHITVAGHSIYDEGSFDRDTYGIQTLVNNGSSGGPAVLSNGQVAGIIFSKSTAANDYAYALSPSYLTKNLAKAEASHRRVSTGACLSD